MTLIMACKRHNVIYSKLTWVDIDIINKPSNTKTSDTTSKGNIKPKNPCLWELRKKREEPKDSNLA